MMVSEVEKQKAARMWLPRAVLELVPNLILDVIEELESKPQTRATIVDALCLAVALVDVQTCEGRWSRAARRAIERLSMLPKILEGQIMLPPAGNLDSESFAFVGAQGERDDAEAMSLAEKITGFLHVDIALAPVASVGYAATVVDALLVAAASIFFAMMGHGTTPPEERTIDCYQVALWRAYVRCYGPQKGVSP